MGSNPDLSGIVNSSFFCARFKMVLPYHLVYALGLVEVGGRRGGWDREPLFPTSKVRSEGLDVKAQEAGIMGRL